MSDAVLSMLFLLAILIGLPAGLLLLRDRWFGRSRSAVDEASQEFLRRLKSPDLEAVETHFGSPLPACVRELYSNQDELLRADFVVSPKPGAPRNQRWYIAYYNPADAESVRDGGKTDERLFAFANDGSGNEYLIDPTQADPEVRFLDHETGELAPVCERFTEFMRWPRSAG